MPLRQIEDDIPVNTIKIQNIELAVILIVLCQ